jgi:hypothetical protein
MPVTVPPESSAPRKVTLPPDTEQGDHGLALVLRDVLRLRYTGPASHPAEVRLLREGLEDEVELATEIVLDWLTGRAPEPDPVEDFLALEGSTSAEVEDVRSSVAARFRWRAERGDAFYTCPECSARFAPARPQPAVDGRVYCGATCRARVRRRGARAA